jgi:hypothetical protein
MEQHLDPKDLRMDTYRPSGGSGWVNAPDTAVRITHIPTGLTVTEESERGVHRNKVLAMEKLTNLVFNSGPRETVEEMQMRDVLRLACLAAKIGEEYHGEQLSDTAPEIVYYRKHDGSVYDAISNDGDRYLLIKRCGIVVDFEQKRVMKRYEDGQVIMKYWAKEEDEALAILRVAAEMRMKEVDREEIAQLQLRIAQLEGKTP